MALKTIADLQRRLNKSAELRQKGDQLHQQAQDIFSKLREEIVSGQTTGDRVRDFGLVFLGADDLKTREPYAKIDTQLKENLNQQFLVIKKEEDVGGCPGITPPACIHPENLSIDTTLYLGIIKSGLDFDFEKQNMVIPTDKYASSQRDNKWKLELGNLGISFYDLIYLDEFVEMRNTAMPNEGHFQRGLKVLVGNELVELYFSVSPHSLSQALKVKEKKERTDQFGFYPDLRYVPALKLLGREAPPAFKEKYENWRTKRKEDILHNLNGTHEDYEIKHWLSEAIELGMHCEPMTITHQPGKITNVPEYINGLCEKYQVKLPEEEKK